MAGIFRGLYSSGDILNPYFHSPISAPTLPIPPVLLRCIFQIDINCCLIIKFSSNINNDAAADDADNASNDDDKRAHRMPTILLQSYFKKIFTEFVSPSNGQRVVSHTILNGTKLFKILK